jgi:hypothetical protein
VNILSTNPAKRRVQVKAALVTCGAIFTLAATIKAVVHALVPTTNNPGDYYGSAVRLDMAAPNAALFFDERADCRISRFGAAPWRTISEPRNDRWANMTVRALRAAGLPEEAARDAVAMLRNAKPDETLGMGDFFGQGHNSAMLFLPSFTTTYRVGNRYTVCHNSATRFGTERQESATVYRVPHNGKVYFVGEFLACGNVSRFYPAPMDAQNALPAPGARGSSLAPYPSPEVGSQRGGPARGPAVVFIPPAETESNTNEVSEPATAVLLGLGLAALLGLRRRR